MTENLPRRWRSGLDAVKIIRKRQRRRRQWTRPWIQWRSQHGAHHALLQELTTEDPDGFRNFLRMKKADFVSSTHAC